jgi:hypothetical protein
MSLDNDTGKSKQVTPDTTTPDDGLNHGKFSAKEEALFLSGLDLHGRDWKAVAKHVITRDSNSIRYLRSDPF